MTTEPTDIPATEPMTQRAKPPKQRTTVPAVQAAANLTTDRHAYGRIPGQLRPSGEPDWSVGFGASTTVRLGGAPGVRIQGDGSSLGPATSPLFLKTLQNYPAVAADMGIPVADDPTDPASLPARTIGGNKTVRAPWKSPMPRRDEIPEVSRQAPHRPSRRGRWTRMLTPLRPKRARRDVGVRA